MSISSPYIGTSNIVLPIPKKQFPEEHRTKSRLGYYATLFNSIEINSTFYKLPRKVTLQRWNEEVPNDFRFSVKLWREITHGKKLVYSDKNLAAFMDVINGLEKKGCLLVQFPGSITTDYHEHVDDLLRKIDDLNSKPSWRVAVEFRSPDWYSQQSTYSMLRQYNSVMVFQDIPKSKTPFTPIIGRTVYLRFHGPTGNYRGTYTKEQLNSYASMIRGWQSQGKTVYSYFNNTLGAAFENSRALIDLTR